MKVLTPLLFPFSVLYGVITHTRNQLYDLGIKPAASFDVPVISVGNLSVGGTGKTPMIEYLIRLLSDGFTIATLSRGYGRKTRGPRIASDSDDAATLGDEPYQFYRKFKGRVVVAVGEERAFAIPYILDRHPDVNLILLDDAFQHRKVRPSFQILLTDFNNLFITDLLLPAGRLRESKSGARRADAIVVTKCPPHVTDDKMMEIEGAIRKFNQRALFFSKIGYGNILPADGQCISGPEKIILVTGLANAKPLEDHIRHNYDMVKHFSFRDHHVYSSRELQHICKVAGEENAIVVTTEKDIVKMDLTIFKQASVSINYLPIEVEFLKGGKEFDEMILNIKGSHVS